ncbi:MAG TPA: AMP-dependent synthetase/ligase [Solirubrobacteraceae bacterium]|nr:AMP-dependent synthetase/ligase [Solirubrobacteraceae bacterium]
MESSTVTPAADRAVHAPTIAEAFRRTVAAHPDRAAIRTLGGAATWTWSELRERVDAFAGGLVNLGLGHGDAMAIMLANRPEFHVVDLAAVTLGATPFSLYGTYAADEIEYVMADAGARIIVTEQAFVGSVLAARPSLPCLEHVIVIDGTAPGGCLDLADVEGANPSFDAEAHWRSVSPGDVLTLIYTSGTTGPPKGVQISHRNVLATARGTERLIGFGDDARVISWLPHAHIAERAAHHYLPVVFGIRVTPCPDQRRIASYLADVRPTWFFAVPRIWEKLKMGLEAMIERRPETERAQTLACLDAAIRKVRLEQRGEDVPGDLSLAVAKADETLFCELRAALGLDRAVAVNTGAAPTPRAVIEFFHAIGIPLAELWGMSETCGFGTVNPPGAIKIGTVGPPAPGVEVRLAPDCELLVRSDVVMLGYRGQPEATARAIDADSWLHTGDIADIDDDGYVTIVDRKKEIIINAAGRKMSPSNIESTLRTASPLIGHAAVIGDGRPYNSALIVLDADFARMWAQQQGLVARELEQLAEEEPVRVAVGEAIDAANAKLARAEQIKRFHIVRGGWQPGSDELTPTMKLRRAPIAERYFEEIEALYAE